MPGPYGIIFALSRHFAPRPEDGQLFLERMNVRVSPPVAINDPTSPYRPHLKVAHRGDPNITVRHGAHGASSDIWEALHHRHICEVLHFPFRSPEQWENKGARRARGDSPLGQYVTALLAKEVGRTEERYDGLVVNDDELVRGLADESLVLDSRVLGALGLGLEPPAHGVTGLDQHVISESVAVRDADIVRLYRHTDELVRRIASIEATTTGPRAHPLTYLVTIVVSAVLLFVALPEAFRDHPYDPRPSRVMHVAIPTLLK